MSKGKGKATFYVSNILLMGSFLSAGLLVVGLGISFSHPHPVKPLAQLRVPSLSDLFLRLLKGEPTALIYLGILVMMFTPFLRVMVAGFSFLVEGDVKYALVALGVLIILLSTILPAML